MKKSVYAVLLLILVLAFASCTAGPNAMEKRPNARGKVAGLWLGIWHGLIAPITFIVSLFSDKVRFYEVHNSGALYNLGFVIGAGLFLSGGILGRKRGKR